MSGRSSSPVFVGRQDELARLDLALEGSSSGSPALVFIGGEAGVGKSRLIADWTARPALTGTWIASGACFELSSGAVPYGPFVEVLRELLEEIPGEQRASVLGSDRASIARILPELEPPANRGVAATTSGVATSADASAQGRLFGAIFDVLARATELRPLVVIAEDIHWADEASRDLVRFIARTVRSERLLVIATYRTDELVRLHPLRPFLADVERLSITDSMTLQPFDEDEVRQQLAAITGTEPEAGAVERIAERSNGNAFFVEELIAAEVAGTGGLTDSLQRILTQRTAGLTDRDRTVLDAAAVIGSRVEHNLLATVTGIDHEVLTTAIRHCVDAQVLVPIASDGPPAYAFRHALVQEALYDEVLPAERVSLHAAIAASLVDRLDRVAELAYHAREAIDLPLALRSSIRAAMAAEQVFAFGEARRHLEMAIEIWGRVPDAEGTAGIDLVSLLERTAHASANSRDVARAAALTRRALDVAGADASPMVKARLYDQLYWYSYESSDLVGADAASRDAIVIATDGGPSAASAIALANLGHRHWSVGRHAEAARVAEEAVAMARAADDPRAEARGRLVLAQALICLGQTGTADDAARLAMDLSGSVEDHNAKAFAAVWWASAASYHGRMSDAVKRARDGLATARRDGTEGRYQNYLETLLNECLIDLGRWDEASTGMRLALARTPDSPAGIWLGTNLARLLIYRGALEEARVLLERGARIPAAGPDRVWQLEETVPFAFADHRPDDGRRSTDDIIAGCPEPERDMTLWWMLIHSLRGEVSRLEAAQARRDEADAEVTRAIARDRLALLRGSGGAAQRAGGAGPLLEAYLAWADAEETRIDGRSDPDAWAEAARTREVTEQPFDRAIAEFRGAEALLLAGAKRDDVVGRLRPARDSARRLAAAPLLEEIEALAVRGRIELDAGGSAPTHADPGVPYGLTPREREVLALVADGWTNRHIGEALFISEKTASVHVTHILTKLGVASRTEAALLAARADLTGVPGESG